MKKAVLFDIDGTLLDAWDFVFEAVKYSLKLHGYPYPSNKKIQQAVGKPLLEFYQVLMPGADSLMLMQAHHQFQEENPHLIKTFPKAGQTLKNLKDRGFALATVSNRAKNSLLRSLKITKIFDHFDLILSAEDVLNPKPHKEHLLVALDYFKVNPASAYMVGDTEDDIVAGKNAGVKTVGTTYGFLGKKIKDHNPDFVIDDLEELIPLLYLPKTTDVK